jgi:hypothetical protein
LSFQESLRASVEEKPGRTPTIGRSAEIERFARKSIQCWRHVREESTNETSNGINKDMELLGCGLVQPAELAFRGILRW